jgi:hypothetical protein
MDTGRVGQLDEIAQPKKQRMPTKKTYRAL